jgi:hypothetical protein
MNRLPLLCLATVLALLLALSEASAYTATVFPDCEHGNGVATTETRKLPPFSVLEVSGAFDVRVTSYRNRQTINITADENILPLIATTTQGSRLVIYPERPICTDMEIIVEINVVDLVALVSSGSDTVKVDEINTSRFSVFMSGAGSVELAGQANYLEAEVTGAGDLVAQNLKTRETTLNISGTGVANVHATEKLKVDIMGVADVNYFGDPKIVEQEIIGVGSINPR